MVSKVELIFYFFYDIIKLGGNMKIAIDKKSLNAIDNENEYIYVFDNEPLEELLNLGLHCVNYKDVDFVDINLTDYDIYCFKKTTLEDKDWYKKPEKKDYKFAIIVPNYNNNHGDYKGKTFLENSIESILNQTYKNFELIFVDDLSTDDSVKVVEFYNDKRVHIIQNKRKKYNGGSRNVGIDYALNNIDFDYFCFLDSDDWWKHKRVLETINKNLYNHEMMTLACEMLGKAGVIYTSPNVPKCYEDLWSVNNNLWCTAWSRVIRKDKIVYFCEDTMMEDRVWTYKLADNLNFKHITSIKEVMYVWNRMNITQSVSITRNDFWNASAYCHIGHQLQMISNIKHKEMIPIIQERIKMCIDKVNNGIYQQY